MSYICKHCGEPGTEQDPVRLEGYGNSLFHPRCIEEARKDREGFEQRWAESQANVKAVPDGS